MNKIYDLHSAPHFKNICANLVELNISGTDVENIAQLKSCPLLSKLVMNDMFNIREPTVEGLVLFGLDTLASCPLLTHLDMGTFGTVEQEEDMIDIKLFFPREFLAQLTTFIVAAGVNRCPLRWLTTDSIYFILEFAVNVRCLDISNHIRGNLNTDCLKNLSKLEQLKMQTPCGMDDFDDIDDQIPMLPKMSLCSNLKFLDIGHFNADCIGDIGLCKKLERLYIDIDEYDSIFEAVKALPNGVQVVQYHSLRFAQ